MAEKTEKPTDKKIKDSAKKGQSFKSKDAITTLVLIFGIYTLTENSHCNEISELMKKIFLSPHNININMLLYDCAMIFLKIILPILLSCFLSGAIISLFQCRFRLATDAIKFDLSKLNPISGIKKIFSINSLKDFIKALIYLISILFSLGLFFIVWRNEVFSLYHISINLVITQWVDLCVSFIKVFFSISIVIIFLDVFIDFFLFIKGLRMEKQEVKKEYKDNEGDPNLKRARKNLHQEILSEEIKSNVRNSTFVMANPTHIALLIYYDPDIAPLPFLLFKSHGLQAKMIIKYAYQQGVPVVKDIPLARKLWHSYRKDSFIDDYCLQNVMQIINWLLQIELQKMGIDFDDDLLKTIEKDRLSE